MSAAAAVDSATCRASPFFAVERAKGVEERAMGITNVVMSGTDGGGGGGHTATENAKECRALTGAEVVFENPATLRG